MSGYIEDALKEINPCGVENKPQTYCTYVLKCKELGTKTGGFVCISKMAYQVARYLYGSDIETEKEDVSESLYPQIGRMIVDPNNSKWDPKILEKANMQAIIDQIMVKGENMLNQARSVGSMRNPINFNCSVEDIVHDL